MTSRDALRIARAIYSNNRLYLALCLLLICGTLPLTTNAQSKTWVLPVVHEEQEYDCADNFAVTDVVARLLWQTFGSVPAHVPTTRISTAPPVEQVKSKTNPKDGADMIWIPAGEFTMGDDEFTNAKPHTVMLDGYYIYRTPVTVAQYLKFCEKTGHAIPNAHDFNPNWSKRDHPILNVSYNDALAYCKWAKVKLPTEAQWEKAARGTDGRKYPWGNTASNDGLSAARPKIYEDGTTPVGSFPLEASPYGVLDMAGDGYQFCSDWYEANFYTTPLATKRNPENSSPPKKEKLRVLRGSSWFLFWDNVAFRTAHRIGVPGDPDAVSGYGFRCVSEK